MKENQSFVTFVNRVITFMQKMIPLRPEKKQMSSVTLPTPLKPSLTDIVDPDIIPRKIGDMVAPNPKWIDSGYDEVGGRTEAHIMLWTDSGRGHVQWPINLRGIVVEQKTVNSFCRIRVMLPNGTSGWTFASFAEIVSSL